MDQITCIKKYSLAFLGILFFGLFVSGMPVLAAGDPVSITINVQPASTGSVDSVLSQQPVILVRDADSNPVSGISVTAFKNSGVGVLRGGKTVITGANGLATFQGLGYSKTDAFTVAFISGDLSTISDSTILSAGVVSVSNSSISVSPSSAVADGKSAVIITVYCKDKYGNVVPGAKVDLSSSGTGDTFVQSDTAGDPGKITVNLSSTKAESKVISVVANGVSLGNTDSISFVPGKIAKLSISADTPVAVSQSSKIVINGLDQFDNTVTNDSSASVSLSVDNGGSLSSALVVLASGTASSSLSKASPGSVNLTALSGSVSAATQIVFTSSDSTAPSVLSQYPAGDASNISISIMPYVDFSKAIDVTTLTTDNVQLRNSLDDSVVPTEVLAANGGKRVILQPILDLDFNTKYYLYISADVGDMVGNTLVSAYSSGIFTTATEARNSSIAQAQVVVQNNSKNTNTSVPASNNQANQQDISGGNSTDTLTPQNIVPGNTADNSVASDTSITSSNDSIPSVPVKNSNGSINNYFQAGLMGVLKNINIGGFGDWFVSNFIWVISIVIIGFVIYISWVIYTKSKEE
jgi:hypothetical protein